MNLGYIDIYQRNKNALDDLAEHFLRTGFYEFVYKHWTEMRKEDRVDYSMLGGPTQRRRFVRQIAKEVKRPFILWEQHGEFIEVNIPRTKRFEPIAAPLFVAYGAEQLMLEQQTRRLVFKTQRVYMHTQGWSLNPASNVILKDWRDYVKSDPEAKKILKVGPVE